MDPVKGMVMLVNSVADRNTKQPERLLSLTTQQIQADVLLKMNHIMIVNAIFVIYVVLSSSSCKQIELELLYVFLTSPDMFRGPGPAGSIGI